MIEYDNGYDNMPLNEYDNMPLNEYRKKRDLNASNEPSGNNGGNDCSNDCNNDNDNKDGHIFVIQEHHSSHLHWDLRLEVDGVLRSWAVPKEPPIGKGVKRLAIQVEDHPIEYANFEGEIPKGNYGAGSVSIWDKGELILEGVNLHKVIFELKGGKMKGKYVLVKVPKMGEKSWLFFMR